MAAVQLEVLLCPVTDVRADAGGEDAMEEPVAVPHMGFNFGTTELRKAYDNKAPRDYSESPLVRLRGRVVDDNGSDPADFRVPIVAHSTGGLRTCCCLQDSGIGTEARGAASWDWKY